MLIINYLECHPASPKSTVNMPRDQPNDNNTVCFDVQTACHSFKCVATKRLSISRVPLQQTAIRRNNLTFLDPDGGWIGIPHKQFWSPVKERDQMDKTFTPNSNLSPLKHPCLPLVGELMNI